MIIIIIIMMMTMMRRRIIIDIIINDITQTACRLPKINPTSFLFGYHVLFFFSQSFQLVA